MLNDFIMKSNRDEKGDITRIEIDAWGREGLPVESGPFDRDQAQLVLSFEGGTPGCTLCRQYRIGKNPARTHWILWESIEDEEATAFSCVTFEPVGSLEDAGEDASKAAMALLLGLWEEHESTGYDKPNCMDFYSAEGLLNTKEIDAILERVWPNSDLLRG